MSTQSIGHAQKAAKVVCIFCATFGFAMYASTLLGVDHIFFNSFGVTPDPHLLRNGAVIFILGAIINLVALHTTHRACHLTATIVNAIIIVHYLLETFVFHHINWLTTTTLLALVLSLSYAVTR